MKLRLKVDKNKVKAAVEATKSFGTSYDGPPPPSGRYRTKLAGLTLDEDKDGKNQITARLVVNEPAQLGDKANPSAKFNGFTFWHRVVLPTDPSDQYYNIQVKALEELTREVTGGYHGALDLFTIATTKGLDTEAKTNRDGKTIVHIVKIGVAEINIGRPIEVNSKLSKTVNAHTGFNYANVSYLVRSAETKAVEDSLEGKDYEEPEAETPEIDLPDDVDGFGSYDENALKAVANDPGEGLDTDVQDDDASEEPEIVVDNDLLGF